MRQARVFFLFLFMTSFLGFEGTSLASKSNSFETNTWDILTGNYNLKYSIALHDRIALTIPVQFYTLSGSIPYWILRAGVPSTTDFTVHLIQPRIGVGAKFYITGEAANGGFFAEPAVHAGLLSTTDFSAFNLAAGSIEDLIDLGDDGFQTKTAFSFSPGLSIGYEWVSDSGFLFSLGAYANWAIVPGTHTLFDALSDAVALFPVQTEAHQATIDLINATRVLVLKEKGIQAGLSINLGYAW